MELLGLLLHLVRVEWTKEIRGYFQNKEEIV